MKKSFILHVFATPALVFAIFLLNFSFSTAQSYSPDKMLIRFEPSTSDTEINNYKSSLGATEIAKTPVSDIRLWYFPTFATAYANHGWIDINEVVNGSVNKAVVNSAGFDFDSGIPSVNVGASNNNSVDPTAFCPEFSLFPPVHSPLVKVAIFDTGIGYTGPNYAPTFCNPNLFSPYYSFQMGYDYVNNDTEPRDDHGHGTHIAGIVAQMATINDDFNLQLFAFKTHDNYGEASLFNIIMALDMAVIKNIKIINMSFSYPVTAPQGNKPDPFKVAIEKARDAGILIIASAGNLEANSTTNSQFYPAAYNCDNIISVASISCDRELSTFSTWSTTNVDVAILGENIQAPHYVSGDMVLKSGTSQAAAIVTGIAAQLASNLNTIHYEPLKCSILEGAEYNGNLEGLILTEGVVNAEEAYSYLSGCASNYLVALPGTQISQATGAVLSVFPNPFRDELTVSFKAEQAGEVTFTVSNAQGSILHSEKRLLDEASDLTFSWKPYESLAPGLYFTQIHTADQTITKKVIKE